MGERNKLLERIDGRAMVRHVVEASLASQVIETRVVTGHEGEAVERELAGLDVDIARNPNYAKGLSTSLAVGVRAIAATGCFDGIIVLLADMPGVTNGHLDHLIAGFDPALGREICLPSISGKRRNPVLFSSRFFDDMARVEGDVGARSVIRDNEGFVFEVAFEEAASFGDIDTPLALTGYRNAIRSISRDPL
jgi:molybdenum cofactor cytidylyltransferase